MAAAWFWSGSPLINPAQAKKSRKTSQPDQSGSGNSGNQANEGNFMMMCSLPGHTNMSRHPYCQYPDFPGPALTLEYSDTLKLFYLKCSQNLLYFLSTEIVAAQKMVWLTFFFIRLCCCFLFLLYQTTDFKRKGHNIRNMLWLLPPTW